MPGKVQSDPLPTWLDSWQVVDKKRENGAIHRKVRALPTTTNLK
jgi:hypothetical protein